MKRHLYWLAGGLLLLSLQCTESSNSDRSLRRSGYSSLQGNRNMSPQDLERKEKELDALQAETEAMYRSLQAKEATLNIKQAQLDSLQKALEEKELELQQREKAARSTRTTGIFFLVIGIILIVLALRKMLANKAPQRAISPQPKPKAQTPVSSSAGKTTTGHTKSSTENDQSAVSSEE